MCTVMRNSALFFSGWLLLTLGGPAGAAAKTPAAGAGKKAAAAVKPVKKAAPSRVPPSLEKARGAYERGDYAAAIREYEAFLPEDAGYLRSREELGWSYLRAGRLESLRGLLVDLEKPILPFEWRMESRVLGAMLALRDCQYERAKSEIERFRREAGIYARALDPRLSPRRTAELEEAVLKMKFVKMELRSRLVLLGRKQMLAGQDGAAAPEPRLAGAQTYPVDGDVWSDEVFRARGSGLSACPSLHKKEGTL